MYENTNSSIDWKGIFLKLIIAVLVVAIVFTGIKTFSKKNNTQKPMTTNVVESNSSSTFTANMEKLKEVGEKYYKDNTDKLPEEGITSMVTLNELIEAGVITTLTDADGKVCDGESSYVTAVKTGDKYTIKANLVCGESYSYVTAYLGENDTKTESETNTEVKTDRVSSSTYTSEKKTETYKNTNTCGSACTPVVNTKTEIDNKVIINTDKNTNTNNNNGNSNRPAQREYIVSFDENGGTCSYKAQTVKEGEYASNPGDCSKKNYKFTGWYLDSKEYNFNTPVTKDIKLVAKYKKTSSTTEKDTDTIETTVYTMAWEKYNINKVSVTHTLDVDIVLDYIEDEMNIDSGDVTRIKILDINYEDAINTKEEALDYREYHADTFLNSVEARKDESIKNTNDSLAYVLSANFDPEEGYKTIAKAKRDGFEVTWTSRNISRTCANPFTLTLEDGSVVNNLCNFGIIYSVIWEFEYEV